MSCHFCYNAHVWAKEAHSEEDYFDEGLHDGNDSSSSTIGKSADGIQLYLNSGGGKPLEIEVCQWINNRWHTIGAYYPKFCPECGRPLDEYNIDERGTRYESKRID